MKEACGHIFGGKAELRTCIGNAAVNVRSCIQGVFGPEMVTAKNRKQIEALDRLINWDISVKQPSWSKSEHFPHLGQKSPKAEPAGTRH